VVKASALDKGLVDFRPGLVDDHNAPFFAAFFEINGDLPGHQVGGLLRVVLVLTVQSNRIFESNTIGNIEMKNGHWILHEVNAAK
jgi:hypothetical protein